MVNRQQRRHPVHPALPIQYPSKKGIGSCGKSRVNPDKKPKGYNCKGKKRDG